MEQIKKCLEQYDCSQKLEVWYSTAEDMITECTSPELKALLQESLLFKRKAVLGTAIKSMINLIINQEQESTVVDNVIQIGTSRAISLRQQIAEEIRAEMLSIAKSGIKIGKLLIEVKDDFETVKEWLEWCSREPVGLKKAQVYNLMNAYTEFGSDPILKEAPSRVLRLIGGIKDESKKAEVKATVRAKILETGSPPDIKSTEKIIKGDDDIQTLKLGGVTDVEPDKDFESVKTDEKTEIQKPLKVEDKLKNTIKALEQELERTKHELEVQESKRLPWLAQFSAPKPHMVLGIKPKADKKVVEIARDRLLQVWTNELEPKAFNAINLAADSMLF